MTFGGQSFFLTFPALELPFGKTTAGNPEERAFAKGPAARMKARSAPATNAGTLVAPFVFRFAFIIQSVAGRNLYHPLRKWRGVSRLATASPSVGGHGGQAADGK